ncbi:MAG: hypothetical protein Q8N21_01945 [bacterium]|nr:hypothetical protein [bacterium]
MLGIIFFAFYFLYDEQKATNHELFITKQDIQNIANQLNKKTDYSYMDKMGNIEKYGGEVSQIGGVGSRFNQITAYFLTEHGYIKPAEDWIKIAFNGPADILYVNCKEGYVTTSCEVNGKIGNIDKDLGCISVIENKMQNLVIIECKKN